MRPDGPSTRERLVERALQSWARKLTDFSRRNNLLYFKAYKNTTLDLLGSEPAAFEALLSGADRVSSLALFPQTEDLQTLNRQLREISRRASANLEEKGLDTLCLAMGSATWPADDGGRPADAPVLLVPIQIDPAGSRSFHLSRSGPAQFNPVLAHALALELGLEVDPDELAALVPLDGDEAAFDPEPLYEELRRRAVKVEGFGVNPRAILGNFAFQKMAMVNDLKEHPQAFVTSDLIAAIAGDEGARTALGSQGSEVEPSSLDAIPPESEFLILDADSSQQCAVANVMAGQNTVVHGPPGTGKSQTIANLIAALAAAGKRVLFVAEKRAALEVVQRRLSQVGLSHLALDLHGAGLSAAKAMRHVAEALNAVRSAPEPAAKDLHTRFSLRRRLLNEHVRRIHSPRAPSGLSVFAIQGEMLRLPAAAHAATRWRGAALDRLTPEVVREISDRLGEAAGLAALFLGEDRSPWVGARVPDGAAVGFAIDLVQHMAQQAPDSLFAPLHLMTRIAGFPSTCSVAGVQPMLDLIQGVHATLEFWSDGVFELDLPAIVSRLAPAAPGRFHALWRCLSDSGYRQARKSVLRLRRAGRARPAILVQELSAAAKQLAEWRAISLTGSRPCKVEGFESASQACTGFLADFAKLEELFPGRPLAQMSPDELLALLNNLAADPVLYELPKLAQIEACLRASGVEALAGEIRRQRPPGATWPLLFRYAWLASCLDGACQADPELRGFRGVTHASYVDEFARLDRERLTLAAARVRRAHAEHAIRAMNQHPEQEQLIRAEAAKSRRHLPLRRVFARAAEVLTSVCPCCMASPLSVSQLLEAKPYFDFVIFDEASQILPEDAAAAIIRGSKTVIAGDANQLPPTTFFSIGNEDDLAGLSEAEPAEGFESLLDMAAPFLRSRYLDWHYRSRDEALIRFSNRHIYGDRLITFPAPGGGPAVTHVAVDQPPGVDGEQESSSAEVPQVVELVLRHARERPHESLGVITMGIRHMDRVQAALDDAVDAHPELAPFFDPERQERFFVKNLERVQGDERDAIILSVGYGKDRAGNLPLRFGPLLSRIGRRRLNVAITRARRRLTLVSSFRAGDIDTARVRPGSGVELLRDYVQYAASEGRLLGDTDRTQVPLNDFEQDIFDVLSGRGLGLIPQLGSSGYRIDMAVKHPARPGEFVLAIECDGASYHSSYTARDRDRLRQQQLEALGWRFHRIWSTDWFLRKEKEVERAIKAYDDAVAFAGHTAAQSSGPVGNGGASASCQVEARPRGPRPPVPRRQSISEYSIGELLRLVRWIQSDGQLRSDDELVAEVVRELGLSRRGKRIETEIRAALAALGPG